MYSNTNKHYSSTLRLQQYQIYQDSNEIYFRFFL